MLYVFEPLALGKFELAFQKKERHYKLLTFFFFLLPIAIVAEVI